VHSLHAKELVATEQLVEGLQDPVEHASELLCIALAANVNAHGVAPGRAGPLANIVVTDYKFRSFRHLHSIDAQVV